MDVDGTYIIVGDDWLEGGGVVEIACRDGSRGESWVSGGF
jgi:hypothetical protein